MARLLILVTGAGGLLGRAVVRHCRESGIDVTPLSRTELDLRGAALHHHVARPSVIVHLAAVVPPQHTDSPESARSTTDIDIAVYHAARQWKTRVVYASTCALYNRSIAGIKVETFPIKVDSQSHYIKAKANGERLFLELPNSAVLRVAAPLGAGIPRQAVASRFVRTLLGGSDIQVWGEGNRQQNYVDVDDLARGFIAAANRDCTGVFNVCASRPTSMKQLAQLVVEACGFGSWSLSGTPDPQEKEYANYSNAAASRAWGWKPLVDVRTSLLNLVEATRRE